MVKLRFVWSHTGRYYELAIRLLYQAYPGANDFFDRPARSDGSMVQKTAMKNNLISLLAETDGLCPYLPACGLCPLGISKCLYSALSELVQMQELLLPCRES